MPKAKRRKTKLNKTEMVKSVFLYGTPNVEKLNYLRQLQKDYINAVNAFIKLLASSENYILELLGNKKKDSNITKLEKENRASNLKSAISQCAYYDAFTKLSNRMNDIKAETHQICQSAFSTSNILFAAVIQNKDKQYMIDKLLEVKYSYKDVEKIAFYDNLISELKAMTTNEFDFQTAEILDCYHMFSAAYKIPYAKNAYVKLDSRVCKLEKSNDIAAPYVLSIIDIRKHSQRFEIPLNTSSNSLRRMEQYKVSPTVSYTITEKNQMKVVVSFEKKVEIPEATDYIGVDVGITDLLYTSNDTTFGSFNEVIANYDKEVLPLLNELNNLKNKKRKLRKVLKRNLPANVKKNIIAKIDRLETNIKSCKKLQRKLNKHDQDQDKVIKDTVKAYIEHIPNKSTVTVLEQLDIKKFKKNKKTNRNLSNFARGKLQKKLIDELNWNGYSFVEVEPAYTSQICPICHNLDSNNRSNEDKKNFTCTCCGFHDDADHVGAVNIKIRATDVKVTEICQKYYGKQRQSALRNYYSEKHEEYLKTEAGATLPNELHCA